MTPAELHNYIFTDLGCCGCGQPEIVLTFLRDILQAIDSRSEIGTDSTLNHGGEAMRQLVWYFLDDKELTEHGSRADMGWLTDKGKEVLAALKSSDIEKLCAADHADDSAPRRLISVPVIKWEPLEGQTFNPEFSGYTAGHYSTGYPDLGWCLYSRGTGACWNQRTKQIKAPAPGLEPERIDGCWYWVESDKVSKDVTGEDAALTSTHILALQWLKDLRDTWKSSKPNSDVAEVLEVVVRRLGRDAAEFATVAPLECAVIDAALAHRKLRTQYAAYTFEDKAFDAAVDALIQYRYAPCYVTPEGLPEAKYLGETKEGERFKIGPPTRMMIEDAGPPSTFVQDRLSEYIAAEGDRSE